MDSREKMYSRDFAPETVVSSLLSRGNGLSQLEDGRRRYSELRDQANLELRKNAFTYHSAILKASKDMQVLEKNLLEFKNTLADEKRALTAVMEINEGSGNKRGDRKSSYFNGSMENVIGRYKANDDKSKAENNVPEIPGWFCEAATDIEDHYEMRRFKAAVDLLVSAKKFYETLDDPEKIRQAEVHYRLILEAEDELINHLLQALKASMDCPFGVDIATCRRLIDHIQFLDKSYDACVSFLDNRTRLLQLATSVMKMDTSITVFIEKRSQMLFSKLAGTVRDFHEFGFHGVNCRSALVGWICFHINCFTSDYSDQIFASSHSLAVVVEAVGSIRKNSLLLNEVGVEGLPIVEADLEAEIARIIAQHVDLFVQSNQRIFQDGKINPILFKSKEAAASYLESVAKSGLGMAALFMDGFQLNVSEQFIQFGKLSLRLVKDLIEISSLSMARNVKSCLHSLVAPCITALQEAAMSGRDINILVLCGTVEFCLKNLLPRIEEAVQEKFTQMNYLFSVEKEALMRLHGSLKKKFTAPTLV